LAGSIPLQSKIANLKSKIEKGLGFATQDHSWCAFVGETTAFRRELHDDADSVRSVTDCEAICLRLARKYPRLSADCCQSNLSNAPGKP
jgi:hypothetical protein